MNFEVIVAGAGPAGSTCAAVCAAAGIRTLLIERERFPREKVCGDCLNPGCWDVLERLGISEAIRRLPHGELRAVDFVAIGGAALSVDLETPEVAIKRSLLDHLLFQHAARAGATVLENITVTGTTPPSSDAKLWKIDTGSGEYRARLLVAADGRNSTVARSAGLLPRIGRERIALQTHVPLPEKFGNRVVMEFLPCGYSGQAPVNERELNLCVVGEARNASALKRFAAEKFGVTHDHPWRTITPLRRAAIHPATPRLFLIGDAARVVEPFTGEGIYYALRTGELAAAAAERMLNGGNAGAAAAWYAAEHAALYRGRLWVNRLARAAVLSPRFTSTLIRAGIISPALLGALTTKVTRPASPAR